MNAIKGDVPEHFEIFRTPLSQLHNYNTRNGFYLDFPSRKRNGEDGRHILELLQWATLPIELERPMPDMIFELERPMPNMIFKRNLKRFQCNSF